MKNKILWLMMLVALTQTGRATLTAIVTPGYQFPLDGSVPPAYNLLNELGQPTIQIYGTVGGSNTLAVGSVTGTQLSSSVADGVTIGFNANNPPGLQLLTAGEYGPGLTNTGTSTLAVNADGTLQFSAPYTNGTAVYNTVGVSPTWAYQTIWQPAKVWPIPTNYFGTNASGVWTNPANAWGYTNITTITNLIVSGTGMPTIQSNDVVPWRALAQSGSNTTATAGALAQGLNSFYQRQVATLNFSANVLSNGVATTTNSLIINTNDQVTAITLQDNSGTYNVMNAAVPVVATTNLTLTNFVSQVAAAINSYPTTPQWTAQVSGGTNILLYEPVLFIPQSGNQVTVTLVANTNNGTLATNTACFVKKTWWNPVLAPEESGQFNLELTVGKSAAVYKNTNWYTTELTVVTTDGGGLGNGVWTNQYFLGDANTNVLLVLQVRSGTESGGVVTGGVTNQPVTVLVPAQDGVYFNAITDGGANANPAFGGYSTLPHYP